MRRGSTAAADRPPLVRCAIYTRKSTEDGLEQEFNSLDAQREACAAYIVSQRHEGWTLVSGYYDDGGFSGGTMERPALARLLEDVRTHRVDVIVVYKIDRLTRSLADFSRIVDVLDRAGASFVSVTQAFNTTTSMGRLTLNVLLSFAQFEREVTGERIRDKIAASKKKGMWMGGVVPLGYRVCARKLVADEAEVASVRTIFERYLALGSVPALQADLTARGIVSRRRTSRSGERIGGAPLSRGALYLLLQNRIYRGEIIHKGCAHPGEHASIITAELFDAAQEQLARNRVDRHSQCNADEPSLLAGFLWDAHGRRMSPSHAAKQARRYRYYVSRAEGEHAKTRLWRVPAGELEELVLGRTLTLLYDEGALHDVIASEDLTAEVLHDALFAARELAQKLRHGRPSERRTLLAQLLRRIEVHETCIGFTFNGAALRALGQHEDAPSEDRYADLPLNIPASLVRVGKEVRLVVPPAHSASPPRRDPALVKLIAKAHAARAAVESAAGARLDEIARTQGHARDYFGVLLRISYLAPDLTAAIMNGRHPPHLNRQSLARTCLPIEWERQRELLKMPKT